MKYYKLVIPYSGLLTVFFEWSALGFFYFNKPDSFSNSLPISYFATISQTRLIFTWFYLFAAILCWVFFRYYVSRHYRVPHYIFAYSLIFFIFVAIFPFQFNDPTSYYMHLFFALNTFVAFIIGLFIIGKHTVDRYVKHASFSSASACALFGILYIFIPKVYELNFFFEAGAWLALQIWIIWITLYIIKKKS